jgi:hypothetical protein
LLNWTSAQEASTWSPCSSRLNVASSVEVTSLHRLHTYTCMLVMSVVIWWRRWWETSLSQLKTVKLCFMKHGCANDNPFLLILKRFNPRHQENFLKGMSVDWCTRHLWMELDLTSTTMGTALVEIVLSWRPSDACCILAVISFISRWRLWR